MGRRKEKQMELSEFTGKHVLTGVDEFVEKISDYGYDEDSNIVAFELDGIVYVASEDPKDGYRSSMKDIKVKEIKIKNKFAPVDIVGKMRGDSDYNKNDVIDFIDCVTGKTVLSVGTENTYDYYPYFVGVFTPENMATNAKTKSAVLGAAGEQQPTGEGQN